MNKLISLFDGIGSLWQALKELGITVNQAYSYEINKYAIQVCQANHPEVKHMGDVIGADFTQHRGAELVAGGFPCTDLSIAKKGRKGLSGEHSRLFWELVRAIQEIQPRYFLVENNASMPKKDRDIITQTLGVEPIMINSALVSAQQRRRLYWTNIPGIGQPIDRGIVLADIIMDAPDLTPYKGMAQWYEPICVNSKSGRGDNPTAQPSLQDRIYDVNGKMVAITTLYQPNIAEPIRLNPGKNIGQSMRIYSVKGKSVCLNANGGEGGA